MQVNNFQVITVENCFFTMLNLALLGETTPAPVIQMRHFMLFAWLHLKLKTCTFFVVYAKQNKLFFLKLFKSNAEDMNAQT